jgi:cold shock protein
MRVTAAHSFSTTYFWSLNNVTTKHTGVVKWFGGNGKNYGFIQPDDGTNDVFVHVSAVGAAGLRDLTEGDHVEFSIEIDSRSGKACAANLEVI